MIVKFDTDLVKIEDQGKIDYRWINDLMQPIAGVNNQPSKYRNLATAKSEK